MIVLQVLRHSDIWVKGRDHITISKPRDISHPSLKALFEIKFWLVVDFAMSDGARLLREIIMAVKEWRISQYPLNSFINGKFLIWVARRWCFPLRRI
jgi:hypothetical protein